jgi:hypothetical protein
VGSLAVVIDRLVHQIARLEAELAERFDHVDRVKRRKLGELFPTHALAAHRFIQRRLHLERSAKACTRTRTRGPRASLSRRADSSTRRDLRRRTSPQPAELRRAVRV